MFFLAHGHVLRRINCKNEEIDIEIRDDGPGLPDEAFLSVFDPFFFRNNNSQEFGYQLDGLLFHRLPSWRKDRRFKTNKVRASRSH